MMRAGQILRAVALTLLGLVAAAGVLVAASGWVASTGFGSRMVARWMTAALDGVVAGRLTIGSLTITPGGDVDLGSLEVVDPAGHPVIRVARARARLELGAWALKTVRVDLELERPQVWLDPDAENGLTIATAFTPVGGAGPGGRDPWSGWKIQVIRLRLRDGAVTWRGSKDRTWLEATGLEVNGAGTLQAAGIAAGLTLAGKVEAPLQGPLAIQLAAHIEGSRLTVPRLSLGAAGSRLEAFGEWDWERETFRAAASRLALAEKDLAALAGQPVTGIDLEGRLYAESDGKRLTAAADLTAPGGAHGGGRVAMALWLGSGSPRSIGFDAALDQLDPARVLSRAPPGRVSFTGRGALTWPVPAPGRVSRGHATVDRLDVALPGLDLKGEGRWRDAGAMSGAFQLTASDLATAGPAVTALLGITLPAITGQAEADLTLAGTEAAPEVALVVRTPRSTVAEVLLTDGRAELKLSGASLELEGSTGLGPFDGAAITVRSAATISPGWKGASFTQLEVGLARQAWTLSAPATVIFDGPRVDRAELRSGAQRLALNGGLDAGGSADVLLEVSQLDLARLPRGLLPASLGPSGRIDGTLRLAGPAVRRMLDAKVVVSDGALASVPALSGFGLKAELAWRRQTGRVELDAALRTTEGAMLEVSSNLPWPITGAAQGVPVTARVAAGGWQLQPLLRAMGTDLPADGRLAGELTLTGSAGSPRLAAQLSVTDGRWDDVAPLGLTASLEGTGPTLRAAAEVRLADGALAKGIVELPFDRGALLAHPGRTLGRLARAAWSARLEAPGTELAALAGKAGLPAGLTGRLSGEATLGGTPASPRGTGSFTLAGGSLAGYPRLGGRVSFDLEQTRTAVEASLESDGVPALQLVASLAAPVEELGRADVQRRAELQLTAVIPRLTLPGSPGAAWSPAGQVAGKLDLTGTLAVPQGSLALDAAGLTLGALPFGDLKGTARTADGATRFDVTLTPVGGGTLHADGTLGLVPGIWTTASALEAAPLRMALTGHQLSVSFLPALLPGNLRAMSGAIETELTVSGSAQAPRLAGTLSVTDVKSTLPGLGAFTHVAFEASLGPEAIRIKEFSAQHGKGRLEGNLALEGLDGAEARLTGSLLATGFTVARSGMDVVTIDARAGLGGRYHERRLEAVVDVEEGATIRLPRKAPRELQSLENRPDIVVGKEPQALAGNGSPGTAPGVASPDHPALEVSVRVRCGGLLVKSDKPRVHLEVRTDSTWDVTATPLQVAGALDAVQGTFEPIGGRLFTVVRGHVAFSGGRLGTAQLDLAADHEAASIRVHATIGGTIETPSLQLTSEPPLDESTLALLIVTGKTEMNVGGTQGPAFKAQDAGMAAAMAVANRAFEDQLGEKMPLDSLTLDSSSVTAGKQLTDRIRVDYVRRFDARPEKGENTDEVRVQYHLSPRWTLETRYGSSGAGGASLMWQKDY